MSLNPPGREDLGLGPKLLGLGVFMLTLWAQPGAMVGVFYDDGIYVVGAKALATGAAYHNIHLPSALPIVHFPPLYSLALSVLWRLWPAFPANVALFQLFDAAALGAAAWIIARHAGRVGLSAPARYLALCAGFVAFPLLALLGVRFSEPLFLFLSVFAIAKADDHAATLRGAAAVGAWAGAATLARTVGLAVFAGVVVALWLRRRRAGLLALAIGGVMLAPWAVWVAIHAPSIDPRLANYTTYLSEAAEAGWKPIITGLELRALWPFAALVLPRFPLVAWYPLAAVVIGTVVWGGIVMARRVPALTLSLAFYLLMVSLWPFRPDRFVWIMAPWLMLCFASGIRALWLLDRRLRWPAVAIVGVVLLGYGRREWISLRGRAFATAAADISRPFAVVTRSIAAEVPPTAVVASEDEALTYLYTDRRSVPGALFRWSGTGTERLPPDQSVQYWCQTGVTHLVVTADGDYAAAVADSLLAAGSPTLTPLFRTTRGGPRLYRFHCDR